MRLNDNFNFRIKSLNNSVVSEAETTLNDKFDEKTIGVNDKVENVKRVLDLIKTPKISEIFLK